MFKIDSATGHTALRNAVRDFVCDQGSAYGLTYAGVGEGVIEDYRGGPDSVAETFTIQAINATTFAVTGTVSGSLPNATVGTPYAEDEIVFTIENDSSTPFQAGDTFLLSTAPKWEAVLDNGTELILKAPGNDGTSEIFVGIRDFSNVPTDYYNWELAGYDGFSGDLAWTAQPNTHRQLYVPLWQNAIPYWLVADGRRLALVAKVSTVYVTAYLGLLQPYLSPLAAPYPLAIGGSMAFASDPTATSVNWRWSSAARTNTAFPFAEHDGNVSDYTNRRTQCRVRRVDGVWDAAFCRSSGGFYTAANLEGRAVVLPASGGGTALRDGPDGSFPLLPVEIVDSSPNFIGRMDGIFITSGFGVGAETVHSRGGLDYVSFPNIYRTTIQDWFALRLD